MINIKNNSILTRCKFYLPNSKEWKFKSSVIYSEYLDREDAQKFFYETYSDYFDKRKGSLGLKDMYHEKIDLETFNMPKIHDKSPVWEMVISFDEFLTLETNPDDFKSVINLVINKMLEDKRYKFNLDKMHFEYAVHVNTKNLHTHMKWFYKDKYEKITYNKTTKKYTKRIVKVKDKDIRTYGKIGKKFFDDLKLDISKFLLAKYNSENKINYDNKLKLLIEYKSKIADELNNKSISEDFFKLIKSFKESKPKSYRYAYLEKDQKKIIDNINEKFFLKNLILTNYKNLFSSDLKKYFENSALNDKEKINELILKELNKLEIDLKNILLKNLKDLNINKKNQKIISLVLSKIIEGKSNQLFNYSNKSKMKFNKISLNFFLNNYYSKKTQNVLEEQLYNIKKLIENQMEEKIK